MSISNKAEQSQTPDEIVEERILTRLATEFPSDVEVLARLKGRLASGTIKIDDWKVQFELLLGKAQATDGEKP